MQESGSIAASRICSFTATTKIKRPGPKASQIRSVHLGSVPVSNHKEEKTHALALEFVFLRLIHIFSKCTVASHRLS